MDTNLEMSVCLGLGFAWSPLLIPQWYIYAWGENCQKSKKRVPTFWQLLALFVLTPKKEEIFFPSWNKISSNKASFFKLQEKPFLEKRPKICKKATQKRRSGTNLRSSDGSNVHPNILWFEFKFFQVQNSVLEKKFKVRKVQN